MSTSTTTTTTGGVNVPTMDEFNAQQAQITQLQSDLAAAKAQVDTLTANEAANESKIATLTAQVATLQTQVNADSAMSTAIKDLQARVAIIQSAATQMAAAPPAAPATALVSSAPPPTSSVHTAPVVMTTSNPVTSPTPTPSVKKKSKVYGALYSWPIKYESGVRKLSDQWQAFRDAVMAHPDQPFVGTFNLDNGNFGQGTNLLSPTQEGAVKVNSDVSWALDQLTAGAPSNLTLLGYVALDYGARDPAIIKQRMRLYRALYPQVKGGSFFDEMPNLDVSKVQYCKDLTAYSQSQYGPGSMTVGNPGTSTMEAFVGSVTTILIYEDRDVLPSIDTVKARTFNGKYPKENFGIIPWNIQTYDSAWVKAVRDMCGLIEITQDGAPTPGSMPPAYTNPWDSASNYWKQLAIDLSATTS